jgi:hypothetical protein
MAAAAKLKTVYSPQAAEKLCQGISHSLFLKLPPRSLAGFDLTVAGGDGSSIPTTPTGLRLQSLHANNASQTLASQLQIQKS